LDVRFEALDLCKKVRKGRGRKRVNFQELAENATKNHQNDNNVKESQKIKTDADDDVDREKIQKDQQNSKRLKQIDRLKHDLEEDDREIRSLAKKLKLNKRKNDTLPKSFVDEGLDC